MSEMAPEAGAVGHRVGGVPMWVWLVGGGVLLYLLVFRSSSSGSSSGTPGQSQTDLSGSTLSFPSGSTTINLTETTNNPQPKPPVKHRTKTVSHTKPPVHHKKPPVKKPPPKKKKPPTKKKGGGGEPED